MATRLTVLAVALFAAAGSRRTFAHEMMPPPAYQAAARTAQVPSSVLFAIALQESGVQRRGKLIPWPWTLNVAGNPLRFETRRSACAALLWALKQWPGWRVDVGLGQINMGHHGHRVEKPCDLLDPYRNLAVSAAILREQHREGSDWLAAVGRYHRPAGGDAADRYKRSVARHLARITAPEQGGTSSQARSP